jgi:integrase
LTWSQVDRVKGIVTLEAGETKNDDARTVYLDDELKEIFNQHWKNRKRNGMLIPNVFHNEKGNGPIVEFRKSWNEGKWDWDTVIKSGKSMSKNGYSSYQPVQPCMISGALP